MGSHRVCLSSGHRPAPPFCALPAALTSHHQLVPQRKDAPAAEHLPTTPTGLTRPNSKCGDIKEATGYGEGGSHLSRMRQ